MSEPIVVSSENRVATITINREARRNSLDHVAMRLLFEALNDCVDSDASVDRPARRGHQGLLRRR